MSWGYLMLKIYFRHLFCSFGLLNLYIRASKVNWRMIWYKFTNQKLLNPRLFSIQHKVFLIICQQHWKDHQGKLTYWDWLMLYLLQPTYDKCEKGFFHLFLKFSIQYLLINHNWFFLLFITNIKKSNYLLCSPFFTNAQHNPVLTMGACFDY